MATITKKVCDYCKKDIFSKDVGYFELPSQSSTSDIVEVCRTCIEKKISALFSDKFKKIVEAYIELESVKYKNKAFIITYKALANSYTNSSVVVAKNEEDAVQKFYKDNPCLHVVSVKLDVIL